MKIVSLKKTGLLLAAVMTVAAVSPAFADWHGGPRPGPDRDWRAHEARAHHYWHGPHPEPSYVYAPPTVYTPPPPVESPGINLILPLNFR